MLIERAALTNKHILEAEAADALDDVNDTEPGARTYGSLIAWNNADQLAMLGILHVILALILVSGKVINDSAYAILSPDCFFLLVWKLSHSFRTVDLRALLRRLRLRPPTQLALPAHSTHRTITFDAYLLHLERQGYLDRTRIGGAGGTSQKRSRGRGRGTTQQGGVGGGEDSDVAWEWRWGPRAASEIGEAAVAGFVAEFLAERTSRGVGGGPGGAGGSTSGGGGDGDGSDEDVGDRRGRAHREDAKKRLAALLKSVERAAGGDLSDITVECSG
jgi:melanoma-associated antigen